MARVVGHRGQVVIEKAIRDQLGVQPGWKAVQRLVDGHVEIRFLPPPHNRSLAGCLRRLIPPDRLNPTDEELAQAVERGFLEAWAEKEARIAESLENSAE